VCPGHSRKPCNLLVNSLFLRRVFASFICGRFLYCKEIQIVKENMEVEDAERVDEGALNAGERCGSSMTV
jgi:hypothetical protein